MSCWVVPSVAAELWGCTIDAVMAKIHNGQVETREDSGWTFLDVAPDSPTMETPKSMMKHAETSDVVSDAEKEALKMPVNQTNDDSNSDADQSFDFRNARKSIEGTRRAPLAEAA